VDSLIVTIQWVFYTSVLLALVIQGISSTN